MLFRLEVWVLSLIASSQKWKHKIHSPGWDISEILSVAETRALQLLCTLGVGVGYL